VTRKRKPLTELVVLAICRRHGDFQLNPLAYRNRSRLKLVEKMRRDGVLLRTRYKPGDWRYTINPKHAEKYL